MLEKTFQRNEKKMCHLSQLILFEKSYLYKRYNNCHNIKCSHQSIVLSRRGVGDKPMSCKPGVAGSIPGFSQSVG